MPLPDPAPTQLGSPESSGALEAGPRSWHRPRALAPGLLGLGLYLGRLRLLGVRAAEDLLGALAREQPLELLRLDRLALQQDLRDPVERVAAFGEQVARRLVRLLDDAP